jgi:hypothetical protein
VEGDEMGREFTIGSMNEREERQKEGIGKSIVREEYGENNFLNTKWRLN